MLEYDRGIAKDLLRNEKLSSPLPSQPSKASTVPWKIAVFNEMRVTHIILSIPQRAVRPSLALTPFYR